MGVVQATGTGKSYLVLQFFYDNVLTQPNKRAVILDPLYGIVDQFKTIFKKEYYNKYLDNKPYNMDNVAFFHYDQLKDLTDEEIKLLEFDYIVLDEFHGLGAEGRGTVTKKFLEANPGAKVLGITATPIRYLDKKRDMGDEIFGDNVIRGITLGEAIRTDVLPTPDYVVGVYSYADTINTIEDKIKKVKDKTQRELLEKDFAKAKQRAETADGLSELFAKKIQKKNGKFIAFCPNMERMDSLKEEIDNGLFDGVNKDVKIYKITYKDGRDASNKIIKQFEEDKSDSLKIMLAIDKFNEGIHVKDVDGCFMFRSTQSPRVYLQQCGRVLSVREDKSFKPLIFDIANNIQCLEIIKEAFATEKGGNGPDGEFGGGDDDLVPFRIDGNDVDLNNFLIDFDKRVSEINNVEQMLACAERYKINLKI